MDLQKVGRRTRQRRRSEGVVWERVEKSKGVREAEVHPPKMGPSRVLLLLLLLWVLCVRWRVLRRWVGGSHGSPPPPRASPLPLVRPIRVCERSSMRKPGCGVCRLLPRRQKGRRKVKGEKKKAVLPIRFRETLPRSWCGSLASAFIGRRRMREEEAEAPPTPSIRAEEVHAAPPPR